MSPAVQSWNDTGAGSGRRSEAGRGCVAAAIPDPVTCRANHPALNMWRSAWPPRRGAFCERPMSSSLLPFGDVGQHGAKPLVLYHGGPVHLLSAVEDPVGQLQALMLDGQPSVRIVDDRDALAGEGTRHLVRLEDEEDLIVEARAGTGKSFTLGSRRTHARAERQAAREGDRSGQGLGAPGRGVRSPGPVSDADHRFESCPGLFPKDRWNPSLDLRWPSGQELRIAVRCRHRGGAGRDRGGLQSQPLRPRRRRTHPGLRGAGPR